MNEKGHGPGREKDNVLFSEEDRPGAGEGSQLKRMVSSYGGGAIGLWGGGGTSRTVVAQRKRWSEEDARAG